MRTPENPLPAARAVWPLLRRAVRNRQVFRPRCELVDPDPDVAFSRDVRIPVSGGIHLTANVFRSRRAIASGEPQPVVMCAHPYDNSLLPYLGRTPLGGPPQQYRIIPQPTPPRFSTQTSWESPDVNFWVGSGYAVVNLNLPGYGTSEGPPTVLSDHQARCYHDAIEWVGAQPWTTGRVGLNGVSFLAISQLAVASCRDYGGPPQALACISPWEGFSDTYREVMCPGGVVDRGFADFWWATEVRPVLGSRAGEFRALNGGRPSEFVRAHPLFDDYWRERAPELDRIETPMFVCASFSDHGLHTTGSFRTFTDSGSEHKWLYTHRGGKWSVYYDPAVQQLTRQFMDCFVKGQRDNGWLERAPVRLEVRSRRDVVHEVREETGWPLPETEYVPLYLDISEQSLSREPLGSSGSTSYRASDGAARFSRTFSKDTELSGHIKLRLWVQTATTGNGGAGPDDMVLFVAVDKLDAHGESVRFWGSVGCEEDTVTRGFCRVSRRELDSGRSTPWQPYLTATSTLPLEPGEIVPVEIELYPSATHFQAGEGISLIISGREIVPTPPYRKERGSRAGMHVLWAGGEYDSHLLVPARGT